MKPFLKLSLLLIVSSLLFNSCTSKLSVTKRHYNKGYYIAHNKGKQTKPDKQNAEGNAKTEKPAPVYTLKVNPERSSDLNAKKETHTAPITAQAIPLSESDGNKTSGELKQNQKPSRTALQPFNLITPLQDLHKTYLLEKSHNGDSDSRGLSLFWVIILVILILWFFGYIAGWGTGGLINLLLLIALILLILWLLRII